jgi:ParB family chromosome partitioning protein
VFGGIEEMAESIRAKGVLQPILVRPTGETTRPGTVIANWHETVAINPGLRAISVYELVAGARRFRGAKLAGLAAIPAVVRELSDRDVLEIQVIENDQREDVHPLDQARGYQALIDQAGYDVPTPGRPDRPQRDVRLPAAAAHAKLIKPFQEWFLKDRIHFGHARLACRLTEADQKELARNFFGWDDAAPTVAHLKADIERRFHLDLNAAPWDKDDAALVAEAGSCTACAKRSGFNPALFPDIAKKDTCTDRACFERKRAAFVQLQVRRLEDRGTEFVRVSGDYHSDDKTLLDRSKYEVVSRKEAKKVPAAELKSAVVVDGDGCGRVLQVRVKSEQKGRGGEQDPYREEQRRRAKRAKAQEALHRALLDRILATVSGPPDLKAMARMAATLFDRLISDAQRELCKRRGWEKPKKAASYDNGWMGKAAAAAVADMDGTELHRFVLEASLVGQVHVAPYSDCRIPDDLKEAAGAYGVDVDRVRAELKEAAKQAGGSAAKRKGTKAKASAKGKRKKAAAPPKASSDEDDEADGAAKRSPPPPDNVNQYVRALPRGQVPWAWQAWNWLARGGTEPANGKLDALVRQGIVERLQELADEAGVALPEAPDGPTEDEAVPPSAVPATAAPGPAVAVLTPADVGLKPGAVEAACHPHLLTLSESKPAKVRSVVEHGGREWVVTPAPAGMPEDVYALRPLYGTVTGNSADPQDSYYGRQVQVGEGATAKFYAIGPRAEVLFVRDAATPTESGKAS